MPRTGGRYQLPPIYLAEDGTTILPQQHNVPLEDIGAALTGSLPRDGSAPMQGNLAMAGRKVTGLANGTAPQDAATFGQIPSQSAFVASISSLSMGAGRMIYALSASEAATIPTATYGRAFLAMGNRADARDYLGLGQVSTLNSINNSNWSGEDLAVANGGTGGSTATQARDNLGLGSLSTANTVNNSNWSGEDLAVINGGTGSSTLAGARANLGIGEAGRFDVVPIANGGTGANTASAARSALGLGSLATANTVNNTNWSGTALSLANGGTGATTAATARTALGLGSLATLSTVNNANWSGTALAVANGGTGATAAPAARTNLGLGSLATLSSVNNANWSGTALALANGGTGATTAVAARTNLGLALGAISGSLPSTTWRLGVDTTEAVISPAKLHEVMPGWGQSMNDVTASRAAGTTYTNTTSRPIMVYISGTVSGGTTNVTVGGVAMPVSDSTGLITVMVPQGVNYSVSSGNITISKWVELR